jgi:hypothetical protein
LDGPESGQTEPSGTNENESGSAEENAAEDKSPSTAGESDGN